MIRLVLFSSILVILTGSCDQAYKDHVVGLLADSAMVVTAHPEASRIGVGILKDGGNAVDAAVAVELALAVCYPAAGNIGGGGFMVVRFSNGSLDAIDYREKAAVSASRDMFLDESGQVMEDQSTYSYKAVGVPGTVDGIIKMHVKHGRLPFDRIIQPSIDLAKKGFQITENQAASLNAVREDFIRYNRVVPPYVQDSLWKEGDLLILEDLGHTLELIRDNGREGMYAGEVANRIAEEMALNGGLITEEDLSAYSATFRKPVTGNYKQYRIISMPPPSSGGIALIQLMNMMEHYPLKEYGFHSVQAVHLMVEAERLVYADRSEHLGDPDYFPVPVNDLLAPGYLSERMSSFDPDKAAKSSDINPGRFSQGESEETTHYSILDAEGNAVAGTTTLNRGFGSKIVIPGTGIILNNQMDDFSIKPGVPNSYGLIGGEANSIHPGKRMLH